VRGMADATGISKRTLVRAREKLGVVSTREGFGEDGNISQAFLIECQRLHEVPILDLALNGVKLRSS
jgi:hypothetical protein